MSHPMTLRVEQEAPEVLVAGLVVLPEDQVPLSVGVQNIRKLIAQVSAAGRWARVAVANHWEVDSSNQII
jgi:hypothetical protein